MTISEYATAWTKAMAKAGCWRPRTVLIHAASLRKLLPLLGAQNLKTLTRADCLRAFMTLRGQTSPATTAIVLSTLRTMLTAAVDDDCLSHNPTLGLAKRLRLNSKTSGHPKAMDEIEVYRFLEAAKGRPTYYTLFSLMLGTGMRLGEALALQWEDVGGDAAHVRHTLGPAYELTLPKNGRERRVQLPASCASLLAAYRIGKAGPFVFPRDRRGIKPLAPRTAQGVMAALVKAAGLPIQFSPHSLRHTFASQHLARGENPQWVRQMLGHSSFRHTTDLYGNWLPAQRRLADAE